MARTRRKTPATEIEQAAGSVQQDLSTGAAGRATRSHQTAGSGVEEGVVPVPAIDPAVAGEADLPVAPDTAEDEELGDDGAQDIPAVAVVSSLFTKSNDVPEKFWFAPDCLDLDTLKRQVVANGGKVVNSKKAADFYVLDDRAASYEENFKEYSERPYDFKQNVRAIDHIWIRDSATYGKRFDLQSYHAKDRSNERKQMERRLARRKPRGFTERDKDVLAKFLLAEEHRCKRENERMYWMGNVLYDKLAERDSTHTAQSWREHFKLKKEDIFARMDRFRQQRRGRLMDDDAEDDDGDYDGAFEPFPLAGSSSAGRRVKRARTEQTDYGLPADSSVADRSYGGAEDLAVSSLLDGRGSSLRRAAARRDSDDDGRGQAFFDAPEYAPGGSRGPVAHQGASMQHATRNLTGGGGQVSVPNNANALQAAGATLSRELQGVISPEQATDLVFACQTLERARNFARHLFPAGYTPELDTPMAFESRKNGFLQFNAAVWAPEEDKLATGQIGNEEDRQQLAALKTGSGVTSIDRINFLRKLALPVGGARFPF